MLTTNNNLPMIMASLVANYGSDNEDSDGEEHCETKQASDSVIQGSSCSRLNTGTVNFLDGSGLQDTDSSDDEATSDEQQIQSLNTKVDKLPNPMASVLPSPTLNNANNSSRMTNSVFVNPFMKAEEAKNSIYEKHVKLTEMVIPDTRKSRKNKKKPMCHRFLKGNCNFGEKCKFSHDIGNDPPGQGGQQNEGKYTSYNVGAEPITDNNEDEDGFKTSKRKRGGLSETLKPAKRSLQNLQKLREEERPWTVQKYT